MVQQQDILNVLKQIIDPDLNQDIVSLEFVRNIVIQGERVAFDIALTTPACPVKGEFQKRAEELVLGLPGVKDVSVNMTTLPRQTTQLTQNTQSGLGKVRSIIAISSCKGGVGKSTMSAYLAMELVRRGFKVGLVDIDIHGPSIPTLLNMQNATVYTNDQRQLIPVGKNHLQVMSFGFLLGDSPAVMRGPMVTRYVQQVMHGTDWGDLDYLFVDMPPGTGDVQLTVTQTVRLSGAVIVTTRQTLSLVDVSRGILMFEKVDVPILGIIENMSYFICNQCAAKHYIFGGSENLTLQERFGIGTLAEIPLLSEFTHQLDEPVANEYIIQAVDQVVRALGKNSIAQKQIPTIDFDDLKTTLTWGSGEQISVNHRDLRLSCRCALCVNELTGEQLLKPENIPGNIVPKEITPLGNYAIGITWSDGHSSGIYPYRMIRKLSAVSCQPSDEKNG